MRTTEKPVARPSDPQINPPLGPLTFYPTISKYPPQILRHLAHNSPCQEASVEPIDIVKLSLVPSVTGSMTCNTSAYAALKQANVCSREAESGRGFPPWNWGIVHLLGLEEHKCMTCEGSL